MKFLILVMLFLVSCSKETTPPKQDPAPIKVTECKELDAEKYSKAFSKLVCALKESKQNPALKSIVLAQWILESGRGNSDLAKKHYNFGGLKWRKEMVDHGTPVSYQAHDGRTEYIKFKSPEAFIKGYWHFIGRYPYKGWEKYKNDPHGYIEFINRAGYTPPTSYYRKVIRLETEAKTLLK